jgi:hypothetical protein
LKITYTATSNESYARLEQKDLSSVLSMLVKLELRDEALLLNVGQRDNLEVYSHAAQLLEDLDL